MQIKPFRLSHSVSPNSGTYWNEFHFVMMQKVTNFALRPDNLPVTATVPAFNTLMSAIQAKITSATALKAITSNPITGFAQQKAFAKQSLISFSVDVMNTVYSYAYSSNNDVLKQETKIAASTLDEMAYSKMLSRVQAAIDSVTPYVTDGSLATYNITASTISSWQSIKDQAAITLTNPEGAIAHRESLNINIQNILLDVMVDITNVADKLIYQFRAANLNYFNEYWANRHLNEHHVHTQLRMHVRDLNGQPVLSGEAFIIGTPASGILNLDGYCLIEHIPHGVHSVSLTTPFGTFEYGPFEFKMGKSLTLNVEIDTTGNIKTPKVTATEEVIAVPVK